MARCNKELECSFHECQRSRGHTGECDLCWATFSEICHCGASARELLCSRGTAGVFQCGGVCGELQDCGLHTCPATCHPGPCIPCSLTLTQVTHCPCGSVSLEQLYQEAGAQLRETCQDPVPLCSRDCTVPPSLPSPNTELDSEDNEDPFSEVVVVKESLSAARTKLSRDLKPSLR